jgi:hypothetical protein
VPELEMKTSRAPIACASRTIASVPPTLSFIISSGAEREWLTMPAVWKMVRTLDRAGSAPQRSLSSGWPSITATSPASCRQGCPFQALRWRTSTAQRAPRAQSARATCRPKNPVAPVSNTLGWFMALSPSTLSGVGLSMLGALTAQGAAAGA